MKKVSLILNIISLLGVVALFILFFTYHPNSHKKGDLEESTDCVPQKGDIVYLQIDTLVNQYDMFNDLKSELESKANAIQSDLSKKGRAFENDAKSFEEKMSKGLLTRAQAETMQNDLLRRDQELKNFTMQKQMEMQEEETVMINKVMNAIKEYMKEYNQTHQYSLVFTTSGQTNVILQGNSNQDITKDFLLQLNQEYVKIRGKK